MINPWTQLPSKKPYVLSADRAVVQTFNEHHSEAPDFILQTQLYPEPFIGD